jgi:ribonuclease Z
MKYLSFFKTISRPIHNIRPEMTYKGPNVVDLSIIANGYNFFAKSFILQTPNEKYLFNCGENLVRCFKSTAKLNHIFLTRKVPQTFLGLPGFLIYLNAQGLKSVTLHSPFSINSIRQTLNYTLKIFDFNLNEYNYRNSSYKFENENCTINAIELDKDTFAYLIDIHKASPSLSTEKLIEYQVPVGPLRKNLKDGHDIILPNGKLVRASDVYDYSKSSNKITLLVLDLPSEDHISAICDNQMINDANIMIHMSDSSILNSDKYKKFIKCKSNVEHVILDENYKNIQSENMFNLQKSLNLIDKKVYVY